MGYSFFFLLFLPVIFHPCRYHFKSSEQKYYNSVRYQQQPLVIICAEICKISKSSVIGVKIQFGVSGKSAVAFGEYQQSSGSEQPRDKTTQPVSESIFRFLYFILFRSVSDAGNDLQNNADKYQYTQYL